MNIYFVLEEYVCPHCRGSGEEPDGRVCHQCFGKGKGWRDVPIGKCEPLLALVARVAELERKVEMLARATGAAKMEDW